MTKKKTENLWDFGFKRGPQIVTPKDAAQIVAVTGLRPDWRCADLGGGSGYLALFIANLVPRGHVTVYEIRESHAEVIRRNVEKSGLKNITLKNEPAQNLSENELDIITLDMKGAETMVESCAAALRPGGFLCVYSPHIEQQKDVVKELGKNGLKHVRTMETIQRDWKIDDWSHPHHSQVVHTGFITVARKK